MEKQEIEKKLILLDVFERATRLVFLDTVDSNLQTRRSGKHKATYDSDIYDDMDEEGN